MTAAVLLFDDVEVLDFAGPFEVFSVAAEMLGGDRLRVLTVAESVREIRAIGGLRVLPERALADVAPPDILVVPGLKLIRMHPEAHAHPFREEEVLMHKLSLATAVTLAAVGFIMLSPTQVAAQSTNAVTDPGGCGDCTLVSETKYKCVGEDKPNEAPYCKSTWIFGIACSTCSGSGAQGSLVSRAESGELRQVVVAGLTLSDTYLVPTRSCGKARVARGYTASASRAANLELPLIEVVARSEASATNAGSDMSQTKL